MRLYSSLALLATLTFVGFLGCDPSVPVANSGNDTGINNADFRGNENGGLTNTGAESPPYIIVGSFNIQTFGVTKMSKPHVVDVLVDIARRFDVLAIQELRDGDNPVVREFLDRVNADGSRFAAAVGPKQRYRLNGEVSNYYEKAVFLYDTTKVELIAPAHVAEDRNAPAMKMHRSPYVGHFRCVNVPADQAYSFVLMNVHVAPKYAQREFVSLQTIIDDVYRYHPSEDDFILIGDLNDEPHRYTRYQWMQQQFSAIPSTDKTNTAQTKCYDNLVFDASRTAEFSGQAGVLNLMTEYNLTKEQAMEVSDHMPVWCVFSTLEAPRAEMTQGQPQVIR